MHTKRVFNRRLFFYLFYRYSCCQGNVDMEILENLHDLRCFLVARYGHAALLKLAWTIAQVKSPSCECV